MNLSISNSILASFATLKSLNDTQKYRSPYQLLSEFINYIIQIKKLHTTTAIEIKGLLNEIFGFNIPEAVIKTSLKSLQYLERKNGIYHVNIKDVKENKSFANVKEESEKQNSSIINQIKLFIKDKTKTDDIKDEDISRDLMSFLVDEHSKSPNNYIKLISEFILVNEGNSYISEILKAIREGSILYIGMNHNISETGNLKKELTLFLNTEVLFSLVGFNGEIYKNLAYDFYSQVKKANSSGKKIRLCYFSDIKKEIDSFFHTAETIVNGRTMPLDKPAMKAIVNGCKTSSDVDIKKADFIHKLQYEYEIYEDKHNNYYDQEYSEYNLESIEVTDVHEQEGWKYISHINKLRHSAIFSDTLETEYLIVTNSNTILTISRLQVEKIKQDSTIGLVGDYAVSVDKITNLLWYKLGNDFGKKELPLNLNVVLKARAILSSDISKKIEILYKEIQEEFEQGKITEEQLAFRLMVLREKPTLPEELEGDSIEESLDFSPEFLSRYEEEVNSNRAAIKKKDEELRMLEEEKQKELSEKDKTIEQKEKELQIQEQEKSMALSELKMYKEIEEKKRKKKQKNINLLKLIFSIGWKMFFVFMIAIGAYNMQKNGGNLVVSSVIFAVDAVALIFSIISIIKKDIKKYGD